MAAHLREEDGVLVIPEGYSAPLLDLNGVEAPILWPERLSARRIDLSHSTITTLPEGLACFELDLTGSCIQALPAGLRVTFEINLTGCHALTALPARLKTGSLILRDCSALTALPEGLDVYFLDISGCTRLTEWPADLCLRVGRLRARECTQLTGLPPGIGALAQLDLAGCRNLSALPEGLEVSAWVDVADTGLSSLPASMHSTQLRWRGVAVDSITAFHPERLRASDVLDEPNAEVRRVKMERMGMQRFLAEAKAEVRHTDTDPGGVRQLLRVRMQGDEDLVALSVTCPSTGRQYMIRVPPHMETCHQAAAWIAGFDDPDAYQPIKET